MDAENEEIVNATQQLKQKESIVEDMFNLPVPLYVV